MKPLYLFNTLSRKKELFNPISASTVKIYSCGPTVYDYAHIGNLRSFLFSDLLHRALRYCGYSVDLVMNITDVDDKTIRESMKRKMSLKDFTESYTEAFLNDIGKLSILKAKFYPKATECIEEMLEMTASLIKKGVAYERNGSVYFQIAAFKDYGKLSKIDLSQTASEKGRRINHDEYGKEEVQDFVLWKAYTEKDGDVFWESPYGKGRPGWHLECAAMIHRYLGEEIDIHTGGIDLCFPHHENEIAESEAVTGKNLSRFWLHCQHLLVNNEKMSKSLGNVYHLKDLLEKGFSPKTIRYALISTHYRSQANFTFEEVKAAEKPIQRINQLIATLKKQLDVTSNNEPSSYYESHLLKHFKKFEASILDDLNVSSALASIFELLHDLPETSIKNLSRYDIQATLSFLKEANDIFAVFDFEAATPLSLPEEVKILLKKRDIARDEKDFKKSDELRDLIKEKGYLVKDTPNGQEINPL